jgi:hypothetical protein
MPLRPLQPEHLQLRRPVAVTSLSGCGCSAPVTRLWAMGPVLVRLFKVVTGSGGGGGGARTRRWLRLRHVGYGAVTAVAAEGALIQHSPCS